MFSIYVAMYSAMHILLFGLICDPDHLCFGRTTYNNINGPGGPFMLVIIGPAGPFMYPDQISRYTPPSGIITNAVPSVTAP